MSRHFIEPLEGRALLSASATARASDVFELFTREQAQLSGSVQKLLAASRVAGEALASAASAIESDLQQLSATPEGAALVERFQTTVDTFSEKLRDDVQAIVDAGVGVGTAIVTDVIELLMHRDDPEQAALDRAKLTADIQQLSQVAGPKVDTLRADLAQAATSITGDLRAIAQALDGDADVQAHRKALRQELQDAARALRVEFKGVSSDGKSFINHARRGR